MKIIRKIKDNNKWQRTKFFREKRAPHCWCCCCSSANLPKDACKLANYCHFPRTNSCKLSLGKGYFEQREIKVRQATFLKSLALIGFRIPRRQGFGALPEDLLKLIKVLSEVSEKKDNFQISKNFVWKISEKFSQKVYNWKINTIIAKSKNQ